MKLDQRVIMVTGGGSGMGAATAKALVAAGAHVALLDINPEALQARAKELKAFSAVCDVADADSAQTAVDRVVAHFGALHGCVNCAGIAPAARIVGRQGPHSLADFKRVIDINLIGTFNLLRLSAAQMMQQEPINDDGERGVIINTASVAAFEGQIGQAAYSASKGGVVAMTLPAAREFGKFGIRVMTIAPGIMDTPMMATMPDAVKDSLSQNVTFPKRLGTASEYADVVKVIFNNGYLNGSVIRLDGAIRMAEK